jgi:hypothetical protein
MACTAPEFAYPAANEICFWHPDLRDHWVNSRVGHDANGPRKAMAATRRPSGIRSRVWSDWLPAQKVALN